MQEKTIRRLHDGERRPCHFCPTHGPHYVVKGWDDVEYCIVCGPKEPLPRTCVDTDCKCCKSCKVCKREEKKRAQIEALEAMTAAQVPEIDDRIKSEIEKFVKARKGEA
jgi:hypothetical protein